MLTPEQLDAMEARCEAATEGPWEHRNLTHSQHAGKDVWHVGQYERDSAFVAMVVVGGDEQSSCDAEFIANARTDMKLLTAELRSLREENAALTQRLETARAAGRITDHLDTGVAT